MYVITELEKKFGWDKLSSWRILLLNAGGQSQRLPSASILGKIFSALPVGNPMYQMLDVKLASYLPFLKRMAPGFFHGPSDTIEVYNAGNASLTWDFKQDGFTALAHPSTLQIGVGHGVYVLAENGKGSKAVVEQRVCLEVLQKPSISKMREKNAILSKPHNERGDNEFIYTDSVFSFDHGVAKKLMEFYRKEMPLNCEIDAYGDFLQALGPKATAEYTKDTRNVGKIEENLVKMREKIFTLLKGTPLTVIALNASQFHHFGTISECLDNFSEKDVLGKQMGFKKWVSSKVLEEGEQEEGGPTKAKRARKRERESNLLGCVMMSAVHKDSNIHERCLVEYCHFEVPVDVGCNNLLSNCEVLAEDVKDGERLKLPNNSFMHTVPITYLNTTKYATVVFGSDDNLKKKVPLENAGDLLYFGKSLKEVFSNAEIKLNADAFKDGSSVVSLWSMKLFPLADTMSKSFIGTIKHITSLKGGSRYSIAAQHRVSMADIMEVKDVSTMLKYRNNLLAIICA